MYIVPKHLWSSVSDPVKYTNSNPVGTGPFTLKSFSPQLIDLVKNPRFWQASKLQVTEERILSFNTFNSMELSIIRGDIDLGPLYVSGIQQTFVQRDPTHNHIFYPPTVVVSLVPNLAKYPLNLLPVRQAISLAIDRNQLEKVGEDNNASVAHPTGLILPSQQTYLSPAYANASFTVDTNKANQLLQSAGFTKGSDGIYADKNGKKLALSITITSAIPAWVTEAQIIVSNLQAIGIQLTVNAPAGGTYFNDMQLGNYDLGYQYGTGGPTPYFLFNTLLNSSQIDFLLSAIQHAILPALTIVLGSVSGWLLSMRNTMITTLTEDYVLLAQAKGLPERRVIFSYAARNAILPNVTGFALALGFVVSGSLVTEMVFSYPGIGFALLQAVQNLDYPLMQGIFLFIAITVLAANFLADLLNVALDPRVC